MVRIADGAWTRRSPRIIPYGIAILFFFLFIPVKAQNNYIGEIKMFAGNFAPVGWALCDGSLLPISQNQALFSLLGTTYGGDGQTTFALPDLRGRFPMHPGTGAGLTTRTLGDKGGTETVTLTAAQMPVHTHAVSAAVDSTVATTDSPQNSLPGRNASATPSYGKTANGSMASSAIVAAPAGGGQPHPNMPPFECVNFIIALVGIFPARN
jgi:microcystin-dependent protein